MREPERLRELARIIDEVTASEHRYHYDDVLARYVAALEPHITDRDVGTLATTDLDTWEQRHEPRYDEGADGRVRAPNIARTVLRLEFGWRVWPMAMAKRPDIQSHMRLHAREHIAYLEGELRVSQQILELAEREGFEDVREEAQGMYAALEREIEQAQRALLSPKLKLDYPYATGEPDVSE